MAKLHEILAVEGDLGTEKKKMVDEANVAFTKKKNLFTGQLKSLTMFDDSRSNENTNEQLEVETTVKEKLDWVTSSIKRYWDACLQKETTNQSACADVVIGDRTLLKNVPATFLLKLESELKSLRGLCENIPTRDPGFKWEKATQEGKDIFIAARDDSFKTEKAMHHKVLVEPTENHPAQIEKWTEDQKVGRYTHRMFSGMISSAEKSDILGRVDKLLRAVKKARQRANEAEVKNVSVDEGVFSYIFDGE